MSINGIGRPKIQDDPTLPKGFSETFRKRFWAKVNKTDSCWLWSAAKDNGTGYGVIGKGHHDNGTVTVHTASWILHKGFIPEGMYVLHNCPNGDNKLCVNPDHLWLGTHADNMKDGINKGTSTAGERNPMAKLTQEKADAIREEYAHGGVFMHDIAAKYGVCKQTVCSIIHGSIWNRNKLVKI